MYGGVIHVFCVQKMIMLKNWKKQISVLLIISLVFTNGSFNSFTLPLNSTPSSIKSDFASTSDTEEANSDNSLESEDEFDEASPSNTDFENEASPSTTESARTSLSNTFENEDEEKNLASPSDTDYENEASPSNIKDVEENLSSTSKTENVEASSASPSETKLENEASPSDLTIIPKSKASISAINENPFGAGAPVYWGLKANGTNYELNLSDNSADFSTGYSYQGSFNAAFANGGAQPWDSYKSTITTVEILRNITPPDDNMEYWFYGLTNCTSFIGLDKINTASVTTMRYLFYNCKNLISLDLSSFNTSNVTVFSDMFRECQKLENLNISSFNTSNAQFMDSLFEHCNKLKSIDLSHFDTSTTETFYAMFRDCYDIENINLSSFNSIACIRMNYMFSNCRNLKIIDVSSFDTSNTQQMNGMFEYCTNLETIYATSKFVTTALISSSIGMFTGCSNKLKGAQGTTWNSGRTSENFARIDRGTSAPGFFSSNKHYWYMTTTTSANDTLHFVSMDSAEWTAATNKGSFTSFIDENQPWNPYKSSITSVIIDDSITPINNCMAYWFCNLTNLTSITNVYNLNAASVGTMSYLFSGCESLPSINVWSLRTLNVTKMDSMFKNCRALTTLDIAMFNTANVVNMSAMFEGMSALTSITFGTNFSMANVTDTSFMFSNCNNLSTFTNLPTLNLNNLQNAESMFNNCASITSINLGASTFNSLTNTNNMFQNCTNLTTINVSTNLRSLPAITNSTNMFMGATNLKGSANYLYNSSHTDASFARVDYGGILPGYFTYIGTTPIDYSTINIDLSNTWIPNFDPKKTSAQHIVFSTASSIPTYDSDFSWTVGTDTYYGQYINSTNTIFVHMHDGIRLNAVTDFSGAFSQYTNLKDITGLSLIDTSNATNMFQLFSGDSSLENIDLSSFNTNLVTSIGYMFDGCNSITSISFSPNFGSASTNMATMFRNCDKLTTLDLTNLNTSSATDMQSMFDDCENLTTLNLDTNFNTSNVTNMSYMFANCSKLKTIFVTNNFTVTSVTSDTDMFAGCLVLEGGGGTKFSDLLVTDKTYARIDNLPTTPGYFSSNDVYKAKLNAGNGKFIDGKSTKIVNIKAGDPTNTFEEPKRTGYTFSSWMVAGSILHPNWDYTTNRETEVSANWNPNSYTVTYVLNGGTGVFPNQPEIYDTPFDLHTASPSYAGYVFTGWKLRNTTNVYKAGEKNVKNLTASDSETVYLDAEYNPCEFYIAFDKNTPISPDPSATNQVSGTMGNQKIKTNTVFTLNENHYTLLGYTFIGWATASCTPAEAETLRDTSSDRIIRDKDTSHTYLRNTNDTITYYALWTRNKYNLKLVQNEDNTATPDPYVNSAEILYDTAFDSTGLFNTAGKVRNTYTFTNKFTEDRLITPLDKKVYHVDNKPFVSALDIFRKTKDLDLYPLWLNTEQTVTLDLRGGTLPNGYTSNTFTAYVEAPYFTKGSAGEPKNNDGSLISPIASLSDIYIFDYWSEDKAGLNKIDAYTTYTDTTINTLYANYKEKVYLTVSFNSNGGTGTMEQERILEGSSYEIPDCNFVKKGYYFISWKDQNGNVYTLPHTIKSLNSDLTLTATWQDNGKGGGGNTGGNDGGNLHNNITDPNNNTTPTVDSIINSIAIYEDNKDLEIIKTNIYARLAKDIINTTLLVTVNSENSVLVRNNDLAITSIKIKKDSVLGKALLASSKYDNIHREINNDPNHMLLVDSFCKVQNGNSEQFFALDKKGNVLKGFVASTRQVYLSLNANNSIVEEVYDRPALYYFYEEPGEYSGILWSAPLILDNILYTFDGQGKLKSAEKLVDESDKMVENGAWEYTPNGNNWAYYTIDEYGHKNYLKNGLFIIELNGKNYSYIFDKSGIMITGLTRYNGNTYYLQEKGDNRGAAYVGEIKIKGISYVFDRNGVMIKSMEKTMNKTNDRRYDYKS